jgi:hypothetical protein
MRGRTCAGAGVAFRNAPSTGGMASGGCGEVAGSGDAVTARRGGIRGCLPAYECRERHSLLLLLRSRLRVLRADRLFSPSSRA